MAADFWEEIHCIEAAMERCGMVVGPPEWLNDSRQPGARAIGVRLNRTWYAIQLWSWYAVPVRFRGGEIATVRAPGDPMGVPVIHVYEPGEFLALWASSVNRWQEQIRPKKLSVVERLAKLLGLGGS